MKLSKRWLLDYTALSFEDRAFAEDMSISGSKVETVEHEGAELENIVVGQVVSIVPHPDSDHMFVCMVNTGGAEAIQIVTGAQNVKQGDFVPVALSPSKIAGGKTIKAGKLRGVLSNGMLCSLDELGLTQNDFPYQTEDGIFILGEDCGKTIGQDIRESLNFNETIIDFEITSNRPDCLSVIGLAREVAATYETELNLAEPPLPLGADAPQAKLSVEIQNPDLCYRYAGAVVCDVKIAPSPRWLRERLRASGVRPINNIVDITNFVMLEYGQPMHAFDLRYVDEGKIIVRNAREGESITTLDGTKRPLEPSMLVIADANKPVAVAGVMGGEYSGIMDDTTTIVFESACFNGLRTRLTAQKLGMRTEASGRYEKELDPASCLPCLYRALELVAQLGAGTLDGGIIDEFPTPKPSRTIHFDAAWINRFIGFSCPEKTQRAILEKLGCKVEGDTVTPPSFRGDLNEPCDLAEEVARIYGYGKIESTPLTGTADGQLTAEQKLRRKVGEILRGQGLTEAMTYSFHSKKNYDKLLLPADHWLRNGVTITNPLGEETSFMRTCPVPSLLEVLGRNYAARNKAAWIYELSKVFRPKETIGTGRDAQLPDEQIKITLGLYGAGADYNLLQGVCETLLEGCGINDYEKKPATESTFLHPGRAAEWFVDGEEIVMIGEVMPQVAENFGIGERCWAAVIQLKLLLEKGNPNPKYKHLPKYPAVTRDLAIVCGKATPAAALSKAIREGAGKLLESLELFDVYEGAQVGAGKKSVAYSLVLRSKETTLTDEQADAAVKRAVKALGAIGAEIRS
ncbi:MAG: phenylalanine--tRNA ligase subunit beta [Oscillospiraceae bacterium]|jgi:phenylalanyl-tRNA synthetase beta chain|nr:phenylalanine--tRNA ligase subunit beta [Oscillospiraceae bacterium]